MFMPITHADFAPPGTPQPAAAEKSPRRPALWTYGLVAAAAGAIGWLVAGAAEAANGTQEHGRARPAATSLPVLPLIATIVTIVLVTAAWLATESWISASQSDAVARALTGGDPARASVLLTRYGCAGCHTIQGLPAADGKVGPPLGDLRQRVFIAGVLPNTADNLINWIVEPRAYSPASAMPETGISQAEARDVAAWLYAH
jgi:cytochrome c2